jgi:hypothetical protein
MSGVEDSFPGQSSECALSNSTPESRLSVVSPWLESVSEQID